MSKKPRKRVSKRLMTLKEMEAKVDLLVNTIFKINSGFKDLAECVNALGTVLEYMRIKLNISEDDLKEHVRKAIYDKETADSAEKTRNTPGLPFENISGEPWLDGDEHTWGDIPGGVP